MQEQLTINPMRELPAATPAKRPHRSFRAIWQSFDEERRAEIKFIIVCVAIIGTLAASIISTYLIKQYNARTQAVFRAQKMDGETYIIKGVTSNWIGDTRLFLANERGEDCGVVMMHMNNPFTNEVNPLFLTAAGRGDEWPFPMKVRVHYRREAWTDENVSDSKENFTCSFLTFKRIDQ